VIEGYWGRISGLREGPGAASCNTRTQNSDLRHNNATKDRGRDEISFLISVKAINGTEGVDVLI
jgi:hypothetical protein